MRIANEILYMPCPCGSGSKFKFCCWPKYQDMLTPDMTRSEIVQTVRRRNAGLDTKWTNSKALDFDEKGQDILAGSHDPKATREYFQRATEADPAYYPAWNNAAVCEWELGNPEAAAEWQRKGLEASSDRNSFGLAAMAVYLHAAGRDDEALSWLERALEDRLPTGRDIVTEICLALSLFRRHADIVAYTTASGMDEDDCVGFFKATALANLGRTSEALPIFERVRIPTYRDVCDTYVSCIQNGTPPLSLRPGEWPYWIPATFPPARWLAHDIDDGRDPFERAPGTIADAFAVLAADGFCTPDELFEVVQDRQSPGMDELRKGLESLVARLNPGPHAPPPPGVTEVKDKPKRGFFFQSPTWRLDIDVTEDSNPETLAGRVVEELVFPYDRNICKFSESVPDDCTSLALLNARIEEGGMDCCPSVALVNLDLMWDVLQDQLTEYFDLCDGGLCRCEVRRDPMYGGPILDLVSGSAKESFMFALPEEKN